jgi:hypothetical protein
MDVKGFLGLSNLEGNNLCYTIDDGTYQNISISEETLTVLVEAMNEIFGSISLARASALRTLLTHTGIGVGKGGSTWLF